MSSFLQACWNPGPHASAAGALQISHVPSHIYLVMFCGCRNVEGQGLQGSSERTMGTHPSMATTTLSLFLQDEQASRLYTWFLDMDHVPHLNVTHSGAVRVKGSSWSVIKHIIGRQQALWAHCGHVWRQQAQFHCSVCDHARRALLSQPSFLS